MSNQPAARFRIGYVTATVWQNESNGNDFYTVDLSRSYKDSGEYKNTSSLNQGDLLNAARVLQRAEDWISRQ